MYVIENGTIQGFTDFSLLYGYNDQTNTTCRYFSSRNFNNFKHDEYYYRLLSFKLAFVVIYQVKCNFRYNLFSWRFKFYLFLKLFTSISQKFIQVLVPDVTRNLKYAIKREKYLSQKILQNHSIKKSRSNIIDV